MSEIARRKYLPAIFAAARAKGITNEELHETIWLAYQKRSLKDLTVQQSMELLDGLNGKQRYRDPRFSADRRAAMNAHGRKDYDASADAAYLVNERELRMLEEAAELRKWSRNQLLGFVRRQIGTDKIRTMQQFNKVFWPLKAMNRRDGMCK